MGDGREITTKVFHSVIGNPADRGLSRERILRQFEGSLDRLGVDRVDMYLVHEPDPETPLEETLGAPCELMRRREGRRDRGEQRRRRLAREGASDWQPVSVVQNSYSLLDREVESEVLPFCRDRGITFTAFGPLAGGWLSGKYRRDEPPPPGSRMTLRPEPYAHLDDAAVYDGLERLARAAGERGADMPTLAFAWLLSHPAGRRRSSSGRGARSISTLPVAGLELALTEDDRYQLASFFP